jgi:hypothetical protein
MSKSKIKTLEFHLYKNGREITSLDGYETQMKKSEDGNWVHVHDYNALKCCGNCTSYRATKDKSNNEHYCKIKGDSWEAFDCCSDWELR